MKHPLCAYPPLSAPRERVFRAWTEPEQLIRRWGPEGFTAPACTLDVRPGGAGRTTMRSAGKHHIVSGAEAIR